MVAGDPQLVRLEVEPNRVPGLVWAPAGEKSFALMSNECAFNFEKLGRKFSSLFDENQVWKNPKLWLQTRTRLTVN